MFFSAYTLGCKLNQLETEAIVDAFGREGFQFLPWEDPALQKRGLTEPGILLINTCTVTSMAEQKARRVIRKALKDKSESCIIVTGCYAQLEKEPLAALDEEHAERLFVIPGEKKDRILDLPRFLAGKNPDTLPLLIASWLNAPLAKQPDPVDGAFRFTPERFSSHSRGFLKIQDGCDNRCAYCRVRIARGKSRSLAADEILKRLLSLEQRGIAEVVLTGVNISQYRSSMALPGLLDFLLEGTEKTRLRLSSINPNELTDDFFRAVSNPRIRPHFHLSLQSGSANILAKMNRSYGPADIERTVALLRQVRGDPFLACDIIAGFPGETEDEFSSTYSLIEKIGFAWIHAFPYSPRPGTAAFDFPKTVSGKEAARRVELLTLLARKGRLDYIRRWEGREVEAVVEAGKGPGNGFAPAVSENYLKLLVKQGAGPAPSPGSLIRCRIMEKDPSRHSDAIAERIDWGRL